jgi:hypothetical protein
VRGHRGAEADGSAGDGTRVVDEARWVVRAGGRLILVQPNFPLNPGGYFDDFTDVAIFTDCSLADYLTSEGWTVEGVVSALLPLTMKSRAATLSFMVPLYLRSPVKLRAGQMLVITTRGAFNA